jgi:CheY-like chemotaxis protein
MKSILIIEDEPGFRRILASFFAGQGYAVQTAPDGLAGIRRLEEWTPSLVLVDHNLPGMTGLDVLRHLAKEAPGVPAVLMSARLDARLEAAARSLGTKACLQKPFTLEQLGELLDGTDPTLSTSRPTGEVERPPERGPCDGGNPTRTVRNPKVSTGRGRP